MLSQSSINQEETGYVLDIDEDKNPLVTINANLMNILKPHQIKGIKFMWDICFESVKKANSEPGTGCILAHCMGLGKTRQIVVLTHTLLANKHIQNFTHVLIVCPLSTVLNWKEEYKKTLHNIPNKVHVAEIMSVSIKKKIEIVRNWQEQKGVLIVGYDAYKALLSAKRKQPHQVRLLTEALLNPGPSLIVCDEGHMLKDGKSQRCKALSKIKTARRIILTGTPLQNNLREYYHMVSFVKPRLLGTEHEYNNRFVNPILNGQYEDSSQADIKLMRMRSHVLHKKLETTVQRYESTELEKYMPKRFDYILSIQMSTLQIKLYQHYLDNIDESQRRLFLNYHNLLNIWTHPALLQYRLDKNNMKTKQTYEEYVEDFDPDTIQNQTELNWFKNLVPADFMTNIKYGPKLEILFAIIDECVRIGDKLLVFSSSTIELDLIEWFLAQSKTIRWRNKFNYYRIDGTVEPDCRMRYCNSFNHENNSVAKLFLISYKVGGLGLNLFAANRVVLMDVSWNPTYDLQSIYRSYRFGQKKNVYIYRLVSMGTMEEVVCSRGITKLAISRRVVDEQQISRHFKSDDLQKMYNLQTEYGERPTPKLPDDRLLANLLTKFNPLLFKYCEHQKLLENLPHEELNDEDRKRAWEEFENEENLLKKNKNPYLPEMNLNINYQNIQNIYRNNQPSTSYQYYGSSTFQNSVYNYPPYNGDLYNLQQFASNPYNYPLLNSHIVQNIQQIPSSANNNQNLNIPCTVTSINENVQNNITNSSTDNNLIPNRSNNIEIIRVPLHNTVNKTSNTDLNLKTVINPKINEPDNENGARNKGNIYSKTEVSPTNVKNSPLQKITVSPKNKYYEETSKTSPNKSPSKHQSPSKKNKIKENKDPKPILVNETKSRRHNIKNYPKSSIFRQRFKRFSNRPHRFRGTRGSDRNSMLPRREHVERSDYPSYDNYNRDRFYDNRHHFNERGRRNLNYEFDKREYF